MGPGPGPRRSRAGRRNRTPPGCRRCSRGKLQPVRGRTPSCSVEHLRWRADDQGRACGLGWQDGVLGVRGRKCLLGHLGTVPPAAFPQPAGEPGHAYPPDALLGLVSDRGGRVKDYGRPKPMAMPVHYISVKHKIPESSTLRRARVLSPDGRQALTGPWLPGPTCISARGSGNLPCDCLFRVRQYPAVAARRSHGLRGNHEGWSGGMVKDVCRCAS